MASGQTSNYGLNQWAAEDKVIRTEFNEDNAKIDAALPRFITGSYVGTGIQEVVHYSVGARPKLVLLALSNRLDSGYWTTCAIACDGINLVGSTGGTGVRLGEDIAITMDENGFTIDHGAWDSDRGLNVAGKTTFYWVMC